MKEKAFVPNTQKKLIELPKDISNDLTRLAVLKAMSTKEYMETILIRHVKKNRTK